MSNGSDINVGSIEEAIEILRNAIRCNEKQFEELGIHILLQDDEEEAIKIVLGNLEILSDMQRSADRELKRQKQINEEHQKLNGELREKVKELEENIEKISESSSNNEELIEKLNSGETFTVNQLGFIKKNFIPKQKIKDKVEEIRHKKEEYEEKGEGLQINDFFHRKFIEATHKIRALEELLQESEENNL